MSAVFIVSTDLTDAVELLSEDVRSHVVTLKMLTLYRDACSVTVYRGVDGWAIRTELVVVQSPWDRRNYPDAAKVVMIDGTDATIMRRAVDDVPRTSVVFKIRDRDLMRFLDAAPQCRWIQSFVSYTTPDTFRTVPSTLSGEVERHREYRHEAAPHFAANYYSEAEIREHLLRGAVWFGARRDGTLAAVCIAFPNYGDVWEIGGVYTATEYRRRGLARTLVLNAVHDLVRDGKRPRYQFRHDNAPSRTLAESVGLVPAFTVAHYLSCRKDR